MNWLRIGAGIISLLTALAVAFQVHSETNPLSPDVTSLVCFILVATCLICFSLGGIKK